VNHREENSLCLENATVAVGGKCLLEKVSYRLAAGEMLAVLGANGAGKSTLLKTLAGERIPNAGEVRLRGRPMGDWAPIELARQRAVLPQSSSLAFPFAVEEVVMMGRAPHVAGVESERDRKLAREAMRQADIAHLARRNYLTLSGGEQQRVHWARVLAQLAGTEGSRFLLLDEPVSSLDMTHQHRCLELARQLTRQGVGVLAVLHDLNLAAMYADRVLLLRAGKPSAEGTPESVFTPEKIEWTFDCRVRVERHPTRHCPLIVAL
jgi:iron complex transport system ATP-binding protein